MAVGGTRTATMKWAGQLCVVTGGAAGLGRALSRLFLARGARVAILDLDTAALESARKELTADFGDVRVICAPCDVTQKEEFSRVVKQDVVSRWGAPDVFINNAGVVSEKDWERCVAVNVGGVIHGTLLAVELMGKHRGGRGGLVLNLSSVAGLYPNPFSPVYVATKFSVTGFSLSMGHPVQYDYHGVRVCAVCPAFADTAIIRSLDNSLYPVGTPVDLIKEMGGLMTAEFVAEGVERLVDDTSLNGVCLRVTKRGGYRYLPNSLEVGPSKGAPAKL